MHKTSISFTHRIIEYLNSIGRRYALAVPSRKTAVKLVTGPLSIPRKPTPSPLPSGTVRGPAASSYEEPRLVARPSSLSAPRSTPLETASRIFRHSLPLPPRRTLRDGRILTSERKNASSMREIVSRRVVFDIFRWYFMDFSIT